jgi:hypothetical protein
VQEALFTVAKLEDFAPADHPLRAIASTGWQDSCWLTPAINR